MKKYPSKISYGLVFFILAVLVGSTIPMISPPVWLGLIINLVIIAFVLHLFWSTNYTIEGTSLKIRSGFVVNKKIEIDTIRMILESNSPISAPAVSFDRLEIKYNKFDSILISPKDKSEFISHITLLNSKIEVQYKSKP